MSDYKLQYSKDGENWNDYDDTTVISMENNGEIFARLLNDLNDTVCFATGVVTNIDKILPQSANIRPSSNNIQLGATITIEVTQNDEQSGIDTNQCRYIYTKSDAKIGTNAADYTGGSFTSSPQNLTTKATSSGNWYLHVLSVDCAGNPVETVSSKIVVNAITSNLKSVGPTIVGPTSAGNVWIWYGNGNFGLQNNYSNIGFMYWTVQKQSNNGELYYNMTYKRGTDTLYTKHWFVSNTVPVVGSSGKVSPLSGWLAYKQIPNAPYGGSYINDSGTLTFSNMNNTFYIGMFASSQGSRGSRIEGTVNTLTISFK